MGSASTPAPALPQLHNPFKAHLQSCLTRAIGVDRSVATALKTVQGLMTAGAWKASSATAFATDATGHQTAAKGGSGGCVSEIRAAIAGEPDTVPSGSWQLRYQMIRRLN